MVLLVNENLKVALIMIKFKLLFFFFLNGALPGNNVLLWTSQAMAVRLTSDHSLAETIKVILM